jgi:LmbE family N-acetylglucosaminyl deacetylase
MTVLVLAPHADDETLGMGGTIRRFVNEGRRVVIAVLTGHGEEPHPIWKPQHWETIRSECRDACARLGVDELEFKELPAACLDYVPGWQVNSVISSLIEQFQPEELYIPFAFDLHRDHGAVAYGAGVAARPYIEGSVRRILAYETLSETHLAYPYMAPAFQPNVFINISETLGDKLAAMQCYQSQLQPDHLPRSLAVLQALAKLRGSHIGVNAAEGFVLLGEYIR